jgi:HK97 family phage prohead protease
MPTRERLDDLDYFAVTLKAEDVDVDTRRREIWALASTPAPDVQGDCVLPSAFTRTLQERKPAEIGVYWMHQYRDIPLGRPLKLEANERGLMTISRIFKTARGDELLEMTRELLAAGSAPGTSIGFRTVRADHRKVNGKTVRCVTDLDLHEYSFTPPNAQANRGSVVLGLKSAAAFPPPVHSRAELEAELVELDGYLSELQATEQQEFYALQAKTAEYRRELVELDGWAWRHGIGEDPREREQRQMVAEVERKVAAQIAADRDEIAAKARAEREREAARLWWARNTGRVGK